MDDHLEDDDQPDDDARRARDLAALASKVLARAGQSDLIWGHVSVRDPHGRGAWLKAAGWGFEEVSSERVTLVGADGVVRAGAGPRHAEYPIHTSIFDARPDVGCVVHTHAEASTAFASLDRPLRPISHDATLFVPPDIARFTGTTGLIRTSELGDQLAAELGGRNAILLPGHGVVVVGADVQSAVMSAVLLDRACRLQLAAEAAGGPSVWTPDDEAIEKRDVCWPARNLEAGWQYLARGVTSGGRFAP